MVPTLFKGYFPFTFFKHNSGYVPCAVQHILELTLPGGVCLPLLHPCSLLGATSLFSLWVCCLLLLNIFASLLFFRLHISVTSYSIRLSLSNLFSIRLSLSNLLIPSRFIHVAANDKFSFLGRVIFHSIYVSYLLNPFICWWMFWLFPYLGYCK